MSHYANLVSKNNPVSENDPASENNLVLENKALRSHLEPTLVNSLAKR